VSYVKLHKEILTSSIWGEDPHTRLVWVTMLVLADWNGEVKASIPGLARIACVPLEACQAAIQKFMGPDPYSRTKDDEGRRVEEIEGGWAILNFDKYRILASREDAREQAAERKRRQREREARNGRTPVTPGHGVSRPVTPRHAEVTVQADITDTDKHEIGDTPTPRANPVLPPTQEEAVAYGERSGITRDCVEKWFWDCDARGWTDRAGQPIRRWQSSLLGYGKTWRGVEARQNTTRGTPAPSKRPAGPSRDPMDPANLKI